MYLVENYLLEICCGSAADAVEAAAAGADRVELCSALLLGGLTPSIGELEIAKAQGVRVMALLRPREGGFCYSDTEFETMERDARLLLAHGADGLVFGVLHPDGTVDEERCRRLSAIAGERECVFHRAIDVVPDWRAAFEILFRLGFRRVLTSGRQPSASEGADTIRAMREYAAGRLEILPGGGVKLHNAAGLLRKTGCRQLHASLKKTVRDPSAGGNPAVRFGSAPPPDEESYGAADRAQISALRALLDGEGR